MELDELLERFPSAKGSGGQYMALCPAHEDRTPSLSIGFGDGRILLHCHAGCETQDVLQAVGLTERDLFSDNGNSNGVETRATKGKSKIVAAYDYFDESGRLLYQVCRFEPKRFCQRSPKSGGGWVPNVKDVRLVLYRLPELLARPSETVYVVEGEKDADRLHALGLLATTNAMGAGNWRDEYSDFLRGRIVVVLTDNDQAGRKHGEQVANSLQGKASSIKVIELPGLPPKGDVSDWLNAGGTVETLTAIIDAAPEWTPTAAKSKERNRSSSLDENCDEPTEAVANAIHTGDGDERETRALPMGEIIERVQKATDGWPRRIGQDLFVHDPQHGIAFLTKPCELFGFLQSKVGVRWYGSIGCVKQAELFAELRRTCLGYSAIEAYPHFPPIKGHYYAHDPVEPGDGSALRTFLDFFAPETPTDRDLIEAAIATVFWGGPPGDRPAFAITAGDRGYGKTTLANAIGALAGGAFDFSLNENLETIKKRLLTTEALVKRVALLDNIKSNKISSADFESLITSRQISGHALYRGERSRPNVLTWFLTVNGPSMSRDFAQRSVLIRLAEPKYSKTWERDFYRFLEQNRGRIFQDVAAFFCRPCAAISGCSRWGTWEGDVLSRVAEPNDTQRLIADRQAALDSDDEEAGDIEDHFGGQLERLGYADTDRVHIPNAIAAAWFNAATNERHPMRAVTRAIRQGAEGGIFKCLTVNPSRKEGRGFLWDPQGDGDVRYDLEDRIAVAKLRDEAELAEARRHGVSNAVGF